MEAISIISRRISVRAVPVALAVGCMGLASCAPNLGPAPQLTPIVSLASELSLKAAASSWPEENWWSRYGDQQLDMLEQEALANAPTLRAADARIRRARVIDRQAGAALQPQVSADALIQGLRQTLNQGFPKSAQGLLPHGLKDQSQIGASLGYQLDFFGRNRAALAAAMSDSKATAADAAAARLQLSTAIASSYAELARLFAQRDAASDAIKVQQSTFVLVSNRLSSGLTTRAEYNQQAALVPAAEAELEAIDRQIDLNRHQLAALAGAGPDRGLSIERPKSVVLQALGLPESLRIDLVGRRPDLVAARLRAEAAASRVQVARLDYYPNIDLTASGGIQSIGFSALLNSSSIVASFGPAIHLPIFTGGRLEGAYRGARADYDEAVAQYDGVLTDALRDIADVLSAQRSVDRELSKAQASLDAATKAYEGFKGGYLAGLTGLLQVLVAENTVISQRRAVADLKAQMLSLDIALVRALGGGFAVRQPAAASK